MTTVLEPLAPGVHRDLPESQYFAAPGLSYSGAKVLLDCPARYRYERDHGQAPKREYDLGHVAHRLVLDKGSEILVVDAADWRTKAAQNDRESARLAGQVPILRHEYEAAERMAKAVLASSAGQLFDTGDAEVSLSWVDEPTGVPLRARVDWLHPHAIVDLKTCDKASPSAIRRAAFDYGYWIQHAFYTAGAAACGLGDLPMVFVFVEKAAPHLTAVVQPDEDAVAYGAAKMREAIDVYDACMQAGNWPGYSEDLQTISLPAWAR